MAKSPISVQHEEMHDTLQTLKQGMRQALKSGYVDLDDAEQGVLVHHLKQANAHLLYSAVHHMDGDYHSALSSMMVAEEHVNHAHALFSAGVDAPEPVKRAVRGIKDNATEAAHNAVYAYSWNHLGGN